MAQRILIVRSDGGVSIMQFAGTWIREIADGSTVETDGSSILETPSEALLALVQSEVEKWAETVRAEGISPVEWHIVDESNLPADRVFRNAWAHDGRGGCLILMDKARALHLDRIRAVRDQQLAALDTPFLRAVESKDTARQAEIAAQKQALRDLPATFDLSAAATPEQLKSLWPADLPRPEEAPGGGTKAAGRDSA